MSDWTAKAGDRVRRLSTGETVEWLGPYVHTPGGWPTHDVIRDSAGEVAVPRSDLEELADPPVCILPPGADADDCTHHDHEVPAPMVSRTLQHADVVYSVVFHEEPAPILGNVMSSGSDSQDRAAESWVIRELESGNAWAWCCVEVRAEWAGHVGSAYLSCCSFADAETAESDCLADLSEYALADLIEGLRSDGWVVTHA